MEKFICICNQTGNRQIQKVGKAEEDTSRLHQIAQVRNAFRNEYVMFACYSTIKIVSNTCVASRETILASQKRRKNMYYRIAIQGDKSSPWQWKSTNISSLDPLIQFLRRFHNLPQDHLRVFSSSSREELGEQLVRENNGLGSNSVTAAHFLQQRMLGSQQGTSTTTPTGSALNGSSRTDTHDKSAAGSLESRQVGREHEAMRAGFWNIMALAELKSSSV